MAIRYVFLGLILMVCSSGIAAIFWNQELKYSLPTPVPANYVSVPAGDRIDLASSDKQLEGPLFLHFYSPDCPCSRFNARHFKELIRDYSDSVKLVIVVPSSVALQKAQATFGFDQHYVVDDQKELMTKCGVYSTPQAVIIDRNNTLYYRGNYNVARYCTKKETNFAELSLIALLNRQPAPFFSAFATQAYGCEIPNEF